METQTTIIVPFLLNPAAAEAFAGKSVGDPCTVEVRGSIKELTAEGVVLNIEAIVPEGYEVAEVSEVNSPSPAMGLGTGAADQTIPSALASRIRRKE